MPNLSPLQLLPRHVVQIIVNHIVGSSRMVYAGIRLGTEEYKSLLEPLLSVCRNFRVVANSLYHHRFRLNIDQRSAELKTRGKYPAQHHLAKNLVIDLNEASVYSGETLKALSEAPYDSCVFPLVREITFVIVPSETGDTDEGTKVEISVLTFVQRIRDMVPMLNEVCVELGNNGDEVEIPRRHLNSLVLRIFQLADRIKYYDHVIPSLPVTFQPGGICHLSHLACVMNADNKQFILLARRNAPTLQSLDISIGWGTCPSSLIQNADGSHVMYSCLTSLELSWWSTRDDDYPRPVFYGDTVPFPSLLSMNFRNRYPFGDDTAFRGNSATLERLQIQMDTPTVKMLRRHSVFRPTSHPRLWFVRISYHYEIIPKAFATADDSMLFALGIGPGASVRELVAADNIENPAATLALLCSHTNLRILTLRIGLEFSDVITLVKSLPLLSDLHSSYPRLGSIANLVPEDELPAYVTATYSPVGKRFRCWHLGDYMVLNYQELIKCVLLLALACPNFDCVVLPSYMYRPFMKSIEETIATDAFKQYAPRLRRLLY